MKTAFKYYKYMILIFSFVFLQNFNIFKNKELIFKKNLIKKNYNLEGKLEKYKNNYFVLNKKDCQIDMYDMNFNKIKSFGEFGKAPGMFSKNTPSTFSVFNDTIIAVDNIAKRITFFNIKNNEFKTINFDRLKENFYIEINKILFFSNNKLLVSCTSAQIFDNKIMLNTELLMHDIVNNVNKNFILESKGEIDPKNINPYLGEEANPVFNKGNVYFCDSNSENIKIFDVNSWSIKNEKYLKKSVKTIKTNKKIENYYLKTIPEQIIKSSNINFPNNYVGIKKIICLSNKILLYTGKNWYDNEFRENKNSLYYLDIVENGKVDTYKVNFYPDDIKYVDINTDKIIILENNDLIEVSLR